MNSHKGGTLMPLPMVHFCTARGCVHDISKLIDCPLFYLGSISPDAIHMRTGADKLSKSITHLHADGSQWINNVLSFLKQNKTKFNYSFLLGYGIHIFTDIIWRDTLYENFKLKYERDCSPIQDITWAYYNDTDQLDFELYKKIQWLQNIWNLLEAAEPISIDGILSADEISAWNKHTLHWYGSGESQHKNPVKYISIEDVMEFIQTAGREIRNILNSEGLVEL